MTVAIATSTIARQAFRLMEMRPLQSFGENTEEAQAAAEQYPEALGMMLEAYDWSFARRLIRPPLSLPGRDDAADPDLPHAFVLPDDMLKLRKVYGTGIRYRVDGMILRASERQILIRGTVQLTNEAQLPSDFKLTVACQLAVLLSPKLVTSRTKRVELKDDLSAAFQRAVTSDQGTASGTRLDGLPQQTSDDWAVGVMR